MSTFAADVRLASDFDTQGPIQVHIPWKSRVEPGQEEPR
jgi:hypothetical protein